MITKLTIHKFIGILALTVENKKAKNLLIVGPNASGKSSVADSLKYLQGREREISKAGRDKEKMLSFKGFGIDEIEASCTLSTAGTARRTGLKPPEFSDDAAATFVQRIQILRKDNLLRFLNEDNDADRYRMFLSLLDLDHLTEKLKAFETKRTELKNAIESKKGEERTMHNRVVFAGLAGSSFREVVQSHLGKVADEFEGYEGTDTIDSLKEKFDRIIDLDTETKIRYLSKTEVTLLTGPSEGDLEKLSGIVKASHTLKELREKQDESTLQKLLHEAIAVYEAGNLSSCPVCLQDRDFDQNRVLDQLRDRETALKDIIDAEQSLLSTIRDNNIEQKLEGWAKLDASLFDAQFSAQIEKARSVCSRFVTDRIIDEENLDFLDALDGLRDLTEKTLGQVKVDLVPFAKNITTFKLANEQLLELRDDWERIEIEIRGLENDRELITECEHSLIEARDETIDQLFQSIQDDTLSIYESLDFGKSEFDGVDLKKLRKSSLQLGVRFFGLDVVDPNSVLSTGHLDLFALALYLAAIRKTYPPGTLIVLEDMITSNDADHKRNIAKVLVNSFDEYRFIITTHEMGFFSTMSDSINYFGKSGDWVQLEFDQWDEDTGANMAKANGVSVSPQNRMAFLKANLTRGDYLKIGGVLRLVTEAFLKRCAKKKKISVEYRDPDGYTSGDFLRDNSLQKALEKDIPNSTTDVAIKEMMFDFFGQPKIVNFLSHHKALTDDVPFADVQKFVLALERLLEYEGKAVFKKLTY